VELPPDASIPARSRSGRQARADEETGYRARPLDQAGVVLGQPRYVEERMTIYLATVSRP